MSTSSITFRRGQRKQLRARLMIEGSAKAGKSFTALRFAYALAPTARVFVVEAGERNSTEKYFGEEIDGRRWEFDIVQLDSYSPEMYVAALREAERQGAETVIFDSLSAEWTGKGGALEIADRGNGPFGGWKTATPLHDAMFEAIQASPCHVIATVRSKMDYVLQANEKGKLEPVRVGLAPIQRDTAPYEFDVLISLDQAHVATVSGSRCRAIEGLSVLKPGADFLRPYINWLETGVQTDAAKPSPRITDEQVLRVNDLLTELRWNVERVSKDWPRKYGVTELVRLNYEQAQQVIKWLEGQVRRVEPAAAQGGHAAQTAPASPPPATPATPTPTSPAGSPPAAQGTSTTTAPAGGAASSPTSPPAPPPTLPPLVPGGITGQQITRLGDLRSEVFGLMGILGHQDKERSTWAAILAKRGVDTARKLTEAQAAELIAALTDKAEAMHATRRHPEETAELAGRFSGDQPAGAVSQSVPDHTVNGAAVASGTP